MSTLCDTRSGRRQYLVTYSQADPQKFPTRDSFAHMLEEEFNSGAAIPKVKHWACCRETHENGGFHYHCAIKLTGNKKWISIKHNTMKKYGIVLNFSGSHDHYISTYRYVCKHDSEVAHHPDHPNLTDAASPKTKNSIASKKKRLSNSDVAQFIRENNVKTYVELFAIAESRKDEGLDDIADFAFSRSEKHLRELITKTWFMKDAPDKVKGIKTSRMEK
eukprot:gene1029-351_t